MTDLLYRRPKPQRPAQSLTTEAHRAIVAPRAIHTCEGTEDDHKYIILNVQEISRHTAFPQFNCKTPSDSSLILLRTTATKMTSSRKMTVVITAAKRAMTRVANAAGRETVPGERRVVMNREVTRATKASAHARSREIARRKTMAHEPRV